MRILIVHNRYQNEGGEDVVVASESELLETRGHEVLLWTKENRTIDSGTNVALAMNAIWSRECRRELDAIIKRIKPHIVHFHNTQPLISPSAYYAARANQVPIVQTIHNFRPVCPNALLLRDSVVCEECVGRTVAWPAVLHRCYRESRGASAIVAATLAFHGLIGTWSLVDRYIALTQFSKKKLVEGGLPEERIAVKPNFTDSPPFTESSAPRRGVLFVGRYSTEKGLLTLLNAWETLDVSIKLIGTGPLFDLIVRSSPPSWVHVGNRPSDAVANAMRNASFLIMPSLSYEGFALVLAEAFAQGLPVIASRLGAMEEIVEDGVTGLHFTAGDSNDLAKKVRWADSHPHSMRTMGANARAHYQEKYAPEQNYQQLMGIYEDAIEHNYRLSAAK